MKISDLFGSKDLSWASDKDAPYDFRGRGDIMVQAYIADIWKNVNPEWLITHKEPTNRIKNRFEKAVERFQSNEPMDPPQIAYTGEDSRYPIQVVNGRHRIAAAAQMGKKWIPIFIDPTQLNDIKSVIRIK